MTESPSPTLGVQIESPESPTESVEAGQAQSELLHEIVENVDPSKIDIQKFSVDGEVDMAGVERFKNVLSANDLEILNQLKPGILFDLFVDVSGDSFSINFAGNTDADANIGLSQVMRGFSAKYKGGGERLENVRKLLVDEGDGVSHDATRRTLAGNFYEGSNFYQEIHNGYTFRISEEDPTKTAQVEQIEQRAEKEVSRLTRTHLRLGNVPDEKAPEIAHFKYKDRQEKYKYKENPSRDVMLEHVYVEAALHGVDPLFALALADSVLPTSEGQFENDLVWTLRTIEQYQTYYENSSGEKAMSDDGHYTTDFVTFLVNSGQELMSHVDRDRFKEMYGNITGQKFEWSEKAPKLAPRLESPRNLEDPEKQRMMSTLVGSDRVHCTSSYGERNDPFTRKRTFHHGIDIGAPSGEPIYASEGGVVLEAKFENGGGGNYVRIQHPSGFITQYLHCSEFAPGIVQGSTVSKGQQIAAVGSTGRSTGPHLHFEVFSLQDPSASPTRSNRVYSDPWAYLQQIA